LPRALWPPSLRAGIGEVRYFVATTASGVVGLTGIYTLTDEAGDAWLGWYGVDERMRGRGYGRALLETTTALARDAGYRTLRLWTTDHPNFAVASRLYEICDFVPQAIEVDYLGRPVLIYSRALNGGSPSPFEGSIAKAMAGAGSRTAPTTSNERSTRRVRG